MKKVDPSIGWLALVSAMANKQIVSFRAQTPQRESMSLCTCIQIEVNLDLKFNEMLLFSEVFICSKNYF